MSTIIKITTAPANNNNNVEHGWSSNTELSVNLKTLLLGDRRMKAGKDYQGVLRLDSEPIVDEYLSRDAHFTFVETVHPGATKHNPHVFIGKLLTVTRRDDGTYRLNFKPLRIGSGFNLERYALGVFNEICIALGGLVEEGGSRR